MAKALPKGITKRPDGRYCIRVMRDGQKVTKYAKTRKEAEALHRELTYELEHGTFIRQDKKTVNEWFDEWIRTYKKPTVKDSTLKEYKSYYNVHVKPAIGSMRIQAVKASNIQKILNSMNEKDYSEKVIHLVNVTISGMMKQAVKEGIIMYNPCDGVTAPKGKPQEPHIVMTVKQQAVFTRYLEDDTQLLNGFIMFQLCTGLRFGECAALQWRDVDLKNKVIHVRHTVHVVGGRDVLTTPKIKCSLRDVPLIPKAIEILKTEKARGTGQKVIAFIDDCYVFDAGGRAVSLQALNRYIKGICRRIRDKEQEEIKKRIRKDTGDCFPDLTSHCMRHTFATRAIENGMQPQTLKTILGHSSLSMTMDLYAHVLEDQKQADMKRIAAAF